MEQRPETAIICTIGPSSDSLEMLEKMFLSGMSVARLNMSHGDKEMHLAVIKKLRKLEAKYNQKIFIALDTKGPETRIFCNSDISIEEGDLIKIYTSDSQKTDSISVNLKSLSFVSVGDKISLDDCKLSLKVQSVNSNEIVAISLNNHVLKSEKRIYFPSLSDEIVFLSDEDKNDIEFAVLHNLDFVFLSFVECPQNIMDVREIIKGTGIKIFSKIESEVAMRNLNVIANLSDGLMVARGDLMNDVGVSNLFSHQKRIAKFSKYLPVIMATEMLESMVKSKIPMRSEVSDIGNAVTDKCCAVMLSAESAIGNHPNHCVDIMRKICLDAEKYISEENDQEENNHINLKKPNMFKNK